MGEIGEWLDDLETRADDDIGIVIDDGSEDEWEHEELAFKTVFARREKKSSEEPDSDSEEEEDEEHEDEDSDDDSRAERMQQRKLKRAQDPGWYVVKRAKRRVKGLFDAFLHYAMTQQRAHQVGLAVP